MAPNVVGNVYKLKVAAGKDCGLRGGRTLISCLELVRCDRSMLEASSVF